jgi:cysteinyl-tRNA synthetase
MPLRYSLEALDAAETGAERMRQALKAEGKAGGASLDVLPFKARFIEAMDDDFNAPQAVAALFDLVREINRGAEKGMDILGAQQMLKELAAVIGFTLQEKKAQLDESVIQELIQKRSEFRKAKEWKKADEIRDELLKSGIAIEDSPRGTTWKVVK